MKIFIACSKKNYNIVPDVVIKLNDLGHTVVLPNCIDDPESEQKAKNTNAHVSFKQQMYAQSDEQIKNVDALLVLNPYDKFNTAYIGGATFLEMYDAWRHNKKIFITHPVTTKIFADEVAGFDCHIIGDDYTQIK